MHPDFNFQIFPGTGAENVFQKGSSEPKEPFQLPAPLHSIVGKKVLAI